ncbi:MAB_1171c family putative transporter [Streptomyces sp. NPDC005393]|uniref:MAB_1171c family putative transporter n=1 Tax=Streptomyces sp. NPDC005393 TaxID=3157041 RepID=UPI00339F5149
MDNQFLYGLGSRVELLGALAMWLVIFLRLPTARHSRQQQMLLIAVMGVAGSITVYLDPVTAALNRTFTFAQSCGLFMNEWGVLGSALILDFVLAAVSRRRPWLIYGSMIVTMATLLVLNFTTAPHAGCVTSISVPWYSPFWWILIAAHLVGTIPCVVLCVRYARQAKGDRSLRVGLLLFAAGFTSSSVFWSVVLAFLLYRPAWLGALFPLNIGVTAWLMTAGAALPLVLRVHQMARNIIALWRLRLLWSELTEAVPHVTLNRPRPVIREVLGSPHSIYLRLYRRVIEIRDALLILQDYVTPETVDVARRHVTAQALPEKQIEPTITACWLEIARQAKAKGASPQPNPLASKHPSGHGLRSETDFLLDVVRARKLPSLRLFALSQTVPHATVPGRYDHKSSAPTKE